MENEKKEMATTVSTENKKTNSKTVTILAVIGGVAVLALLGFYTGIFADILSMIIGSVEKIIKSVIAVIFMIVLHKLFGIAFQAVQKKSGRIATFATLISSVEKYAVIILGCCWILSIIGVNISTIFASVGILALIIGFGAESLVADLVTGIFILFENEYNVGDIIEADGFRGTVKEIGIRTVSIEDAGGNIKIVNNSHLKNIINRSNNRSLVVCEMKVAYKTNHEKMDRVLAKELPLIKDKYQNVFTRDIIFTGIEKVEDSGITLRFVAEVQEENFFDGRRILNRELKELFDREKMSVPYFSESENKQKMKQEIHINENEYGSRCMEISQPEEISQRGEEEISIPTVEVFKEEPSYENSSQSRKENPKKKREKKEKLHKQLMSKMAYTVCCAAAVVTIAQSAGVGTIEDNVIAAGGSVEADFRFTIQWNDDTKNADDLDAHCLQPDGVEIFFGNPITETGSLDVDIVYPEEKPAIENIIYKDKYKMVEGTYQLYVHCFADNPGGNGFKAQVEIDDRVYTFEYSQRLQGGDIVKIAEVTLKNGRFSLKELMEKVSANGY